MVGELYVVCDLSKWNFLRIFIPGPGNVGKGLSAEWWGCFNGCLFVLTSPQIEGSRIVQFLPSRFSKLFDVCFHRHSWLLAHQVKDLSLSGSKSQVCFAIGRKNTFAAEGHETPLMVG